MRVAVCALAVVSLGCNSNRTPVAVDAVVDAAAYVSAEARQPDRAADHGTLCSVDHWCAEGPVAGELDLLRGVWGSSASDVFVVGDAGTIVHRRL
jgi:hypothetical protein